MTVRFLNIDLPEGLPGEKIHARYDSGTVNFLMTKNGRAEFVESGLQNGWKYVIITKVSLQDRVAESFTLPYITGVSRTYRPPTRSDRAALHALRIRAVIPVRPIPPQN